MELIINILLFCFLCGFGLIFFTKSDTIINDASTLQSATSLTSSVADVFGSGDGSLDSIKDTYSNAAVNGDLVYLYYNEDYVSCQASDSEYYIEICKIPDDDNKVNINFRKKDDSIVYSITACNHKVPTLADAKEVLP